jgi:hypothetical protein
MIKLTDILNEYSINNPNRREIFDTLYNTFPQMFKYVIDEPTLEDLLKAFDYEDYTLEDLLIAEWGFDEDSKELKDTTQLIKNYYKYIKPGDVKKSDGERTSVTGYSYAEMVCVPDDDDCFMVFTKF